MTTTSALIVVSVQRSNKILCKGESREVFEKHSWENEGDGDQVPKWAQWRQSTVRSSKRHPDVDEDSTGPDGCYRRRWGHTWLFPVHGSRRGWDWVRKEPGTVEEPKFLKFLAFSMKAGWRNALVLLSLQGLWALNFFTDVSYQKRKSSTSQNRQKQRKQGKGTGSRKHAKKF